MTQFLPNAQLGPFIFSSGAANPKAIDGQKRTNYVIEHEIPGREGGQVEYFGSQQPRYRLQGFFAPLNDSLTSGGIAGAIVSGQSTVFSTPEQSWAYFIGLKGSGAQLLQLESTWSRMSGYPILYENDFYYITNETFAIELGEAYPYYPYTLDLMRATYRSYGNTSGTTTYNPAAANVYISGFIISWNLSGGVPQGETVIGLGVYVATVASGHAAVGIYSGLGAAFKLVAASASQNVHSGWNYFPINPSFTTTSGQNTYSIALIGDVSNTSGYTFLFSDGGGTTFSWGTGFIFANGFPASFSPTFAGQSGTEIKSAMVVQA